MLFFPTFHPPDIEGEIRGKSSNELWAARIAKRKLIDEMGYDLDLVTITSCDADTQFPPNYYACLTYKFATSRMRYRRFWQAPIFYYNNVWDVPAPLRLSNSLGGLNQLVKLTRKYAIRFPQSTYSLSLRMADEVGYWDPDIISEDWHMMLKCFFLLNGNVNVEPIFLPVGNDGVRAHGYFRTFWEHYQQSRRHAWGASDISYAIKMACRPPGDIAAAALPPHLERLREPRPLVQPVVPDHHRARRARRRSSSCAPRVSCPNPSRR